MLKQFRKCYPQGSLVSELVTIDCGQYIIRVSVQVNGIILATGLGADREIEKAEDKARQRALETLDLDSNSFQSPIVKEVSSPQPLKPEPLPSVSETVEIVPQKSSEKSPSESSKKKGKTAFSPINKPVSPASSSLPTLSPEIEPEIEENEPLMEISPPPEEPSFPLESPLFDLEEEKTTNGKHSSYLEEPSLYLSESMDFSDIIAQSDAELKRLRWTQEEGRDYLIRTYGKRSRQLLSDEELIEFLHYLQSLPTPPQGD